MHRRASKKLKIESRDVPWRVYTDMRDGFVVRRFMKRLTELCGGIVEKWCTASLRKCAWKMYRRTAVRLYGPNTPPSQTRRVKNIIHILN